MSIPSVEKRRKERDRQERQKAKADKRKQRRDDRPARDSSGGEVDPDIAGIVPGPQPLPEE